MGRAAAAGARGTGRWPCMSHSGASRTLSRPPGHCAPAAAGSAGSDASRAHRLLAAAAAPPAGRTAQSSECAATPGRQSVGHPQPEARPLPARWKSRSAQAVVVPPPAPVPSPAPAFAGNADTAGCRTGRGTVAALLGARTLRPRRPGCASPVSRLPDGELDRAAGRNCDRWRAGLGPIDDLRGSSDSPARRSTTVAVAGATHLGQHAAGARHSARSAERGERRAHRDQCRHLAARRLSRSLPGRRHRCVICCGRRRRARRAARAQWIAAPPPGPRLVVAIGSTTPLDLGAAAGYRAGGRLSRRPALCAWTSQRAAAPISRW